MKKASSQLSNIFSSFIFYITIYIVIEIVVFLFLYQTVSQNFNNNLNYKLKESQELIDKVISSNRLYLKNIINEIAIETDYIELLKLCGHTKTEKLAHVKNDLYNSLNPLYKAIKLNGIEILNIYNVSGDLLLSFNNPVFNQKNSHWIPKENIEINKQYQEGLENDNDDIAYRFLFPVIDNQTLLGMVEFGIPINCFLREFGDLFTEEMHLFVKKNIVPETLLKDSLFTKYYKECSFKGYYRYDQRNDSRYGCNFNANRILDLETQTSRELLILSNNNNSLIQEVSFVTNCEIDTLSVLISFIPLKDTQGNHKAYLVLTEKDLYLKSIKQVFSRVYIFGSIFFALITFLIYFLIVGRKKAIKHENLNKEQSDLLRSANKKLRENHESILLQNEEMASQTDELESKKELLTAVNKELEKMSIITSETNNLIYIFNEKGELDWFNEAFYKKIGYNISEYKKLFGKSIIELSQNENIFEYYNQCIESKQSVSYNSSSISKSGDKFWFHTTLTPIFEDDKLKMIIAIDADITELIKAEKELDKQHRLTIDQRDEIMYQKKELTDSIVYAKRIQEAILSNPSQLKKFLSDCFIIYLPKDIVSGDFFWHYRVDDNHFLITVDCTGHGVPGAFMSIIGTYLLNNIIIQNKVYDPAEILKNLNRKLKIALKSNDPELQTNDGMDIALTKFNLDEEKIVFAGAVRPLFIFNGNEFSEIKGDKNPITSYITDQTRNVFTNQELPFAKGDVFYMFSDGIIDQFGGEHEKKFLSKRLKQLLIDINMLSMKEQQKIIYNTFLSWKGSLEQVDDVLIIGVRNT